MSVKSAWSVFHAELKARILPPLLENKKGRKTNTHTHTHTNTHTQSLQSDDSSVLSIHCLTWLVRKTCFYATQINLSISRFNSFFLNYTLHENVQIRSFFWSVFYRIQSKCGKIRTRKNSVFGHFSRSIYPLLVLFHKQCFPQRLFMNISRSISVI